MPGVLVKYKGNTIIDLSETATKKIKTRGKYCEDDIYVSYYKPTELNAELYVDSSPSADIQTDDLWIDISDSGGGGEYTIYTSATAPTGAQEGDVWIDTSEDILKTEYSVSGLRMSESSSLTDTGLTIQVDTAGIYNISWIGFRTNTSGTSGSQLYIDNIAYGTENTSFTNSYIQYTELQNVSLSAGQILTIYARARSSSYAMIVGNLIVKKAGD